MPSTPKSKSGSPRTAARRQELRRALPKPTLDVRSVFQQPDFVNAALVALGFLAVLSVLVIWSRSELKVQVGRIMLDTRLKRLDYRVPDEVMTEAQRNEARKSAPHVYALNDTYLGRLAASLSGLPKAIADKSIDEINPELREEYQLKKAGLLALAPFAVEGETTQEWKGWVDNLTQFRLPAAPLIGTDDYQTYWVAREYSTSLKRLLRRTSGDMEEIPRDARAIELLPDREGDTQDFDTRLHQIVLSAGFPPEVVPYVAAKLAYDTTPTIYFDQEATDILGNADAEDVATVYHEHGEGEVIYRRGDTLTLKQYEEATDEAREFWLGAPWVQRWLPRIGIIGLMSMASIFMIGYMLLFYPRIMRNPMRLFAICALLAVMLAVTVLVGTRTPNLIFLGAVAPTVFVAIVALLAYDQRIALFLSAMQCALATLALDQGVGLFLLLFAGCGTAVAQLREMRHRSSLIQASAITGTVLTVGAVLLGLVQTPLVHDAWKQVLMNGFWAGFGGLAVGFVILGILPTIERWFDITTGMTLAELRDPKQPLLKQLQQKAPGTYNHSLQVANIAEAAASAIGGNALLVYVGALYHDIGKMNKPEYFVENQAGESKHDKLSPAMSLLVIVGHVKDGIELAREYGLPRSLQHFIESHHGTTLVEYFYHAAKSQSEHDVQEIEFRYPGPKPRTREAGILMLSDAVESATRSMADPNPARIESLVRQLSRKRLTDGQFDQCDLTFRELGLVEDSMIKSMNAIYHGRIKYPGQGQAEKDKAAAEAAAREADIATQTQASA